MKEKWALEKGSYRGGMLRNLGRKETDGEQVLHAKGARNKET